MTTTARITSDQLSSPRYHGQAVRAVGKLVAVDETSVQLQLAGPEGPAAIVHCPNGPHKFMGETVGKGVYEVIGTVGTDGSLTEMQAVYFGDNFDLNMYAEMVALTHQFPDIF